MRIITGPGWLYGARPQGHGGHSGHGGHLDGRQPLIAPSRDQPHYVIYSFSFPRFQLRRGGNGSELLNALISRKIYFPPPQEQHDPLSIAPDIALHICNPTSYLPLYTCIPEQHVRPQIMIFPGLAVIRSPCIVLIYQGWSPCLYYHTHGNPWLWL